MTYIYICICYILSHFFSLQRRNENEGAVESYSKRFPQVQIQKKKGNEKNI